MLVYGGYFESHVPVCDDLRTLVRANAITETEKVPKKAVEVCVASRERISNTK